MGAGFDSILERKMQKTEKKFEKKTDNMNMARIYIDVYRGARKKERESELHTVVFISLTSPRFALLDCAPIDVDV